jgi:peptide-methionine (S)-S-oxide reductase
MKELKKYRIFAALFVLVACGNSSTMNSKQLTTNNNQSDTQNTMQGKTELATFGEGCFWCSEAIFQSLDGVVQVTSGYSGGTVANPTYEQVCTGTTGHAEVIQVEYDPSKIGYEELLQAFWKSHDPTTLNRQGNDVGTQYRSVIFYHNENQKELAEKYKKQLDSSGSWSASIVRRLSHSKTFITPKIIIRTISGCMGMSLIASL